MLLLVTTVQLQLITRNLKKQAYWINLVQVSIFSCNLFLLHLCFLIVYIYIYMIDVTFNKRRKSCQFTLRNLFFGTTEHLEC